LAFRFSHAYQVLNILALSSNYIAPSAAETL